MNKIYVLTEVDPGPVSPYDLTWDQRVTDEVAQHLAVLGHRFTEVKVTRVADHRDFVLLFSKIQPVSVKPDDGVAVNTLPIPGFPRRVE